MYLIEIPVTTTGSAGSATGTATYSPPDGAMLWGILSSLSIDYHASAPNTTVVEVEETGGLGRIVVTVPAGNTDLTVQPTTVVHDSSGAVVSGSTAPFAFYGTGMKVTVTLSNPLTNCVIVKALFV